jgi:shikimate kinase
VRGIGSRMPATERKDRTSQASATKASARSSGSIAAVFLVGFMGAGKTSVGRALGQRLNWIFEDLDDRIVQRERHSVAEIFQNSGEAAFRRAETLALQEVVEESHGEVSRGVSRIVALGGGAFAQKANRQLLEAAGVATVFLDAGVDELWRRCTKQVAESGATRPLAQGKEKFRKLYDSRRKHYLKAAFHIETSNIEIGSRTVEAIAAEIEQVLGLRKLALRIEQGDLE